MTVKLSKTAKRGEISFSNFGVSLIAEMPAFTIKDSSRYSGIERSKVEPVLDTNGYGFCAYFVVVL